MVRSIQELGPFRIGKTLEMLPPMVEDKGFRSPLRR
jgi:hypothetical protein